MSMGSMVAASLAPAGGGTDEGLPEELRPPNVRGEAESAAQACGGRRRRQVRRWGKVPASPPIYSRIRRRFGSDAPTISTTRGGNGYATCPTSVYGSFDPITAITTRAVCEEAACVAETYSSI